MATYGSVEELIVILQAKLTEAVEKATTQTMLDANQEIQRFYSVGHPVMYSRTGTLGASVNFDSVVSSGNEAYGKVWLDKGIGYSTGTFSGIEVIDAAENHTSGVLGMPGFWAITEQKAQKNLDAAVRSVF